MRREKTLMEKAGGTVNETTAGETTTTHEI